MTDTEIIKAKKIIHSLHAYCFLTQPTYKQMGCDFCENDFDILNKFIDDNNRQKAEIERLENELKITRKYIHENNLEFGLLSKIEHNSLCETETYESR